MTFNVVMAV